MDAPEGRRCHACGGVVTVVPAHKKSAAPPFCSQKGCRAAYQRWRYRHEPAYRERLIANVRARQRRLRYTPVYGPLRAQDQTTV